MRSGLTVLLMVFGLMLVADSAQAAGLYGPRSEYSPSVFSYGWRGLAVGGLFGLSLGYVVARDDGFESDDWKPVAYGLGIGALGGMAIGLTLGFVDLEDDRPGMGNIALRAGRSISWDSPSQRLADGPAEDPFLRREYRAGWSL